jgi:hypothetical protein
MSQTPKCRAVLTGDLVNSRNADRQKVDATMARLADAALTIGSWANYPALFTRFRGDGWQMLVGDASLALWAAVHILATLRADADMLATRIGIGIGHVDHHSDTDLLAASGTAFIQSGKALDHLTRRERMFIKGGPPFVTGADKAVCMLLDERIRHWSQPQAEAAALYIWPETATNSDLDRPEPESQALIATRFGITPQAANYRLAGAGAVVILEALRAQSEDFRKRLT